MDDTTISLFSLGVSALGVLVTGIFSCLIWKANKLAAKAASDAAAAAKDSAALAKVALDDQKQQGDHLKVAIRGEVTHRIILTFVQIIAVSRETDTEEDLKKLSSNLQLREDWQKYFSLEECTAISRAELALKNYIKSYVPNGIPNDQLNQDFKVATTNLYEVFRGVSHLLIETELGKGISDKLRDK
ncbi:hypothetical protein [Bacillus thuringiensis]|uniref:hypothetical protein n=1 Tax=Bacillus thuringiensis TaxID=1428 RepID=UPI000BF4AE79|nr:hypothetical protein [Bacillus thuringiensis]PFB88585.1 hypothetical protein CN283_11785 [Bacillus thuringiensis]PGM15564.1 hypothetical protein CN938_11095 [Bacillus thuringiensis]